MYFIAAALGVIGFFMVLSLRDRVAKLEDLLTKRGQQGAPAATPAMQPPAAAPYGPQPAIQAAPYLAPSPGPSRLGAWLQEDWLLKLGALLLLIGFGWLTSYAFSHNWIGPMGRITLGVVGGAGIMLVGWWRIRRFVHQGSIFLVLGSTVILLTLFAAREMYNFFTPVSALSMMAASLALVALLSVIYRSRGLAVVSIILAAIAPHLTNMPSGYSLPALFFYLLIVVLGSIWIIGLTGWIEVPLAAFIAIGVHSVLRLMTLGMSELAPLLPFAYVFAAIFFVAGMTRMLKTRPGDGKELRADLLLATGNGALLIFWVVRAAPDVWQSLILSAWMVVFVSASFVVFRITGRREPFYAYAAVGVAMLGAATAAELSGAALTIAYTIEVALISLVTMAVTRDRDASERISFLFAIPMFFSMQSLFWGSWGTVVVGTDFFVLLLLGVSLLGLGLFFMRSYRQSGSAVSVLSKALTVFGSVYLYVLIWNALHVGLRGNSDAAVGAALVIYTIIGLVTYFSGTVQGKGLRYYGGVLLAFVVGRLLLVDVWQMELGGRIVVFFLVGALLIITAFVGRRFRIRKAPGQL